MSRYFFIVSLFTLSWLSAFSQNTVIFQRNDPRTYSVRSGSDKPGNTDASRVIRMLAEAEERSISTYQFEVQWNQSLQVIRESSRSLLIQISHSGFRLSQPQKVRGFDISSLLIPSWVDFTYSFRPGNTPASSTYSVVKRIQQGSAEREERRLTDSTSNSAGLSMASLFLVYNESAINALIKRLKLIKDYYQSDYTLHQMRDRLMRVNPQDAAFLDMQNAELMQVEGFIADTKSKRFDQELDLYGYDPVNLRDRLARLEEEASQKRAVMNQTKATLHLFYYNAGLDLKARGRYQQAYEAFTRSVQENPLFAPSLYQLALMDYEEGRYGESECRTRTILEDMVPDPDIERMAREHIFRLEDTYVQTGEERMKQGRVDDALDFFKRAANLCNTVRNVPCHERLETDLRNAHQAKLNQLLDQARKSYQQGNLDQADRDVEKALHYQQVNYRYLPQSSEVTDMRTAIRQKMYDRSVENARAALAAGSADAALAQLVKARTMQQQDGLNVHPDFNNLLRASAKPSFLNKCNAAKQAARNNDLTQARSLQRELSGMLDNYQLAGDAEAMASFNDLKGMIFSQECANAQKAFDELAGKAGLAFDKKDFLEAEKQIRAALSLSDRNAECRLAEGNLRSSLDSMRSAIVYQQLIQDMLRLQATGQFAQALDTYRRAGSHYQQEGVSRFGINHEDIDAFSQVKCTDDFMSFLAGSYIDQGEYDHALVVFKSILTRNGGKVNSAMGRGLQRLGTELAVRDKRSGSASDWRSGVLKYTNGDKRLKALEKGYKQGWKKG